MACRTRGRAGSPRRPCRPRRRRRPWPRCSSSKRSALLDRVVQLAVAVGQLAPDDEQLEALGEERVVAVVAGERRDLHRVAGDERRPRSAPIRDGGLEQLLDDLAAAPARVRRRRRARRRARAARRPACDGCTSTPIASLIEIDHPRPRATAGRGRPRSSPIVDDRRAEWRRWRPV